ncbi:hypothetical protein [Rhizobium lentis]|uniref:hypothetical protein n=1 Tax=Rhizobium lentis TaxID=1138194 RepID=UPI001C8395F2|nr:hypothetical protein [Rhizobium lentis]MBX5046980.1 hypothetical protein [Rhizobium lentis]MBX5058992.1 hypothetical protein [Rhizobium lentis]
MHSKQRQYEKATRAVMSEEQIRKAQENWEYSARRFPEEHKRVAALIEERGLTGHREIVDWYSRYKAPIDAHRVAAIELFKDTTYCGPFGVGEAKATTPTTAGGTKLDAIFTPSVKPEGAN